MKANNRTIQNLETDLFRRSISQFALTIFCFALFIFGVKAQNGEAIFKQNCGVCHRVGGGRMVGPDLMGVTTKRSEAWLMKWVKGSQALIQSGDADAKAISVEFNGLIMPDQTISDADIKAVFAFITSNSAPATASVDTVKKKVIPDASLTATPEMVQQGENIFLGSQALANGGPACISCHNIDYKGLIPGGLLAKDLTTAYSRLGGDAGISGILGAPPFPAMTQAYRDKPISEKEITSVIAFLNKVDKDKPNQQASTMNPLLYGGICGLSVLILLILLIWNQRKKHTVKKNIYNRQLKSI